MQPSAATCRAEHARQLALAENDPLSNRRAIASVAAAAWAAETKRAEKREAGTTVALSVGDLAIAREFAEEAEDAIRHAG